MPSDLKMNTCDCDMKSKIIKESIATWQNQWEKTPSHMLNIKRTTKRWDLSKYSTEELTHLTHSYHLEPPRCDNCDTTLTVTHILYDCGLIGAARAKYGIDFTSLGNDVEKN
jgi:hypothetical protein